MPRRYYTRYRPRAYGKRRKWSPTLGQGSLTTAASTNNSGFSVSVLCGNSSVQGTTTPVSTIIKVKNFKVVLDIVSVTTAGVARNNFYAIMFVPQGFTVGVNTPQEHPEWIMVWRTVDVGRGSDSSTPTSTNIQLSSRLTRNLNSGDQIVLFNSVFNGGSNANITLSTTFYSSFVTCNN